MKTKELIRLLNEADPSGEEECCVGNAASLDVIPLPAYWDGYLQNLVEDETGKVIRGQIIATGIKIEIHATSIGDILMDDTSLEVEYIGKPSQHIKDWVESTRQRNIDLDNEIDRQDFIKFVLNKFKNGELVATEEVIDESIDIARDYFNANMDARDEMPPDLRLFQSWQDRGEECPSWYKRKLMWWEREFKIDLVENKVIIERTKYAH